jgi:hypothetical protein
MGMGFRDEIGDRDRRPGWRSAVLAAFAAASLAAVLLAPTARAAGFEEVGMRFEGRTGALESQAGSHPFAWRTTVLFGREGVGTGGLKDLRIRVPAGLIGTPRLLPECDHAAFLVNACPDSTALGLLSVLSEGGLGGESSLPILVQAPVFNIEPLPGNGAELGAFPVAVNVALPLTIAIDLSASDPARLLASLTNVSQVVPIFGYQLTLWGRPADPGHDLYRGHCGATYEIGLEAFQPLSTGTCPFTAADSAFLTLPTSCQARDAEFEATAWSAPTLPFTAALPNALQPSGCGSLSYSPGLRATPTTAAASAPTGLDLDFEALDPGIASAGGRAAADTRSATLELPPGMTVNPPVGSGLVGCAPAEVAAELPDSDPATGCPEAAKIGTASVETPLFEKPVAADVYVAAPEDNPFGSLLALYLVLRDPERGVVLSLPIQVDADPATGRLTARFDRIPELPLSHLSLRLNSGPHAPLATPAGCGTHAIEYSLAPSSGNPPLTGRESFETASGCGAAFAPEVSAGTESNAGGTAAPFVLDLRAAAAAPNLESLRVTLPPGLAADLSAAAICPEAGAPSGSCPAESRLGFARVALGAGPEPLWVPGGVVPDSGVYLAGPYSGAPYSLVVSVPGRAGPFELGRVVLRGPVEIDPSTGQISVGFGDLPQIRDGIPLHYRAVRLVLDRPGFVRNPTSCEPERVVLTATAATGAVATTSARFQAADCGALGFRPRLAVGLSGALGRNGHPRVEVRLRPRDGEANLSAASFDLPRGQLLDTRRIRALCARELPPANCPAKSRLGHVTLRSPLLREPLRGAIHLRAPSHRYPDLVAEVEGGGVRFVVQGRTGSARGRIRVRLHDLPDIPLSQAAIVLAGGRRGIVVNSAGLCRRKPRARAALNAHNGRRATLRPVLKLAGC